MFGKLLFLIIYPDIIMFQKSKDCAVVTYFHGGGLMYDSAVMFNDTYLLGTFVNQGIVTVKLF